MHSNLDSNNFLTKKNAYIYENTYHVANRQSLFYHGKEQKQWNTRVLRILIKLSDHSPNWPKVVPWLVVWKNMIIFEIALKLKSRRVAQFYLVIYSSKMRILHIFAILGTLHIWQRCKRLSVDRMDFCGKNKPLLA